MKKNGYIDVEVKTPVEGVKIGDTVYVSATEFGQLDDEAMVTCITDDDKKVLMPKRNLIIK